MATPILEQTLSALAADMHEATGVRFASAISTYLTDATNGHGAVTSAHTPGDLRARFAESLPIGQRPLAEIVERIERDVLSDAIKLSHPRYMGVSVSPPLPAAIWTEALIAAMNQSMRAGVMSPVLTPIERQVVRWLADRVGFTAASGGTLTSGGTEANFSALLAARAAIAPDAWADGLGDNLPIVLCGDNAHVSVTRAVAQLGLGARRAIRVQLRDHRIDTDALQRAIDDAARRSIKVMAVVATAGDSITGAFDDIRRISEICRAHRIWLHVDGAHGATALLSTVHRHRLSGIEDAQSVTWDPHKMMLMPLPTSVLLVRDGAALERAFGAEPMSTARDDGDADLGARSFMTSRRADALKLWVGLQRYGADGLAALYDHLCDLTLALHRAVSSRDDFIALHAPDANVLCFRYVGAHRPNDSAVDLMNRRLHHRFISAGRGFIATAILDGRFALRVTMMNPWTQHRHVRELLDELAGLADTAR